MRHKVRHLLLWSVVATLIPFAAAASVTWMMAESDLSIATLFGRGELLPPTALLSAQTVVEMSAVPDRRRGRLWYTLICLSLSVLIISSALYGSLALGGRDELALRVGGASLAMFVCSAVASVAGIRIVQFTRKRREA